MATACLLSDAYPGSSLIASSQTQHTGSKIRGYDEISSSQFGTSLTDTGSTYPENDTHNNSQPIITKVIGGNNNNISNIGTKSNISQKIIEYRLYLEQINNERQYVSAQLQLFHKQLESIDSPSTRVSFPTSDEVFGKISRAKYQNSSNHMLNQIGNFFTSNGLGDDSEATMLNLLFALFLVVIGYLMASRKPA